MRYSRTQFEQLPEDATDAQIRLTAESLRRRYYDPMMLIKYDDFIYWRKKDVLSEFDRLAALPEDAPELMAINSAAPSEVVETQLGMLLSQYELLCGLRSSQAGAWDVINELYEDD
jgi:hypothetical protein